jgi:hypothetical protein
MPITFRPVSVERAEQLRTAGGSRGQGLALIREFLAYTDQSGEASAEFSPSDFEPVKVTAEDGSVSTRELRPSELVSKVKSAAESHNYAVTAVADAGNVVLIRIPDDERPDTSRGEGVPKPRSADAAKPGRKPKASKSE